MRTIKFRGKRIDNGEWVYGDLHTNDCTEIIVHDGYRAESYYPVDPDTVGQFTGLTDKNGKEIYEGDIIYAEFNDVSNANCLIEWDEEKACFGLMDDSEYKYKMDGYDFPHFDNTILNNFMKNSKIFEVIGNIHDNPEFMEGGEK